MAKKFAKMQVIITHSIQPEQSLKSRILKLNPVINISVKQAVCLVLWGQKHIQSVLTLKQFLFPVSLLCSWTKPLIM